MGGEAEVYFLWRLSEIAREMDVLLPVNLARELR